MSRELSPTQNIERSITRKYRDTIWSPFVRAVKQYRLIEQGDCIAVCISGGKDSMLLAKCMQLLHRYSDFPFELKFLVMDPGYSAENLQRIEDNAALLGIPITLRQTNIFAVADRAEKYPCYLCARMRRGYLYRFASDMGCNKIALGHHMSDVIETTVMAMFHSSQLQGMMPKLHSTNFDRMELIRPLYCVHEDDILSWCRYNDLHFLRCACRFTEGIESGEMQSKRAEVKALIRQLKSENPNIEKSIFNAIHAVHIDTFPSYKSGGREHSFLDDYDDRSDDKKKS